MPHLVDFQLLSLDAECYQIQETLHIGKDMYLLTKEENIPMIPILYQFGLMINIQFLVLCIISISVVTSVTQIHFCHLDLHISSWLRWSPADTLRYVTIACQKSQRNVNKWSPSKIEESFEIKVASTLKDLNEAWVPQEKMGQNESCMDQTFCCTSGEPSAKGEFVEIYWCEAWNFYQMRSQITSLVCLSTAWMRREKLSNTLAAEGSVRRCLHAI